jgi:hypothetical protein
LNGREPTREQGSWPNVRYAWLLLTYALAADVFYRAGFARQTFGQIADLLFIWIGSALVVTAGVTSLALMAVLAMALLWKRRV